MLGVIYIFFRSFLKVLNVISIIIEAIMCYLDVIELFLVLTDGLVGPVNNALNITNLIFHSDC